MSISFKKYIDIVSGVGGATIVRQRDLIGRLFTSNPKVPVDGYLEMTELADVAAYFGSSSEEYLRARFYFGWISKNITAAQKISFARYANVAAAPRIYGARSVTTLAAWKLITTGTLTLTAGANTANLTAINFAAATSLADVASTLQTAVRAATGTQFTTAIVTYDAIAGAFNFTGSVAETAAMSVTVTGTADDIATRLGWGTTAVFSPGTDVRTVTDTLDANVDTSNNFASFVFLPTLTTEEIIEAAAWNDARNVEFMYCVPVTDLNRDALSAALLGYSGCTLTLTPTAGQYDEMVPMIILAATDYARRNSTVNYMFQQFPDLSAKVTTTPASMELDNQRVNYYGVTQTAGQLLAFYQRGVMCGGSQDPVDQNTYANELWLKDAAAANLMGLLLAKGKVSANDTGRGEIITILQDAIDRALFNGTISVGKPLTTIQKLYIGNLTGDDLAWQQVQTLGYWLDCTMESYVTLSGLTEWKAVYTLIYSKDDTIRKVDGSHVLI